jgi:hypothetical protein
LKGDLARLRVVLSRLPRDAAGMECCVCVSGEMASCDPPVWEPLVEAVGELLTAGFMLMYEVHLDNGPTVYAYKHRCTRRYLHLSENGAAYAFTRCERYAPTRLDYAIEEALSYWWLLGTYDEAEAQAVRDVHLRANRRSSGMP